MSYNKIIETKEKIHNFIETMYKEKNDLKLFRDNFETLKIIDAGSHEYMGGEYLVVDNVLLLYNANNALYHELLHCASNKRDDVCIFDGFYFCTQNENDPRKPLGEGLNEAFTEHLSKEYFNDTVYDITLDFYISRLIDIIGYDKMKQYYFSANLYNFIEEFSKYISKDEVLEFMDNLDELHESRKPGKSDDLFNQQKAMFFCSEILLKAFINKLNKTKLSKKEKYDELFTYITLHEKIIFPDLNETLTTFPSYASITNSFLEIGVKMSDEFYQILKDAEIIFPEEVIFKYLTEDNNKEGNTK